MFMIIHMVNRDDVSKQLRTDVKLPVHTDIDLLLVKYFVLHIIKKLKSFMTQIISAWVLRYMQRISSICRTTLSCVSLAVCLKGLMFNSTFSYYHNLDF